MDGSTAHIRPSYVFEDSTQIWGVRNKKSCQELKTNKPVYGVLHRCQGSSMVAREGVVWILISEYGHPGSSGHMTESDD